MYGTLVTERPGGDTNMWRSSPPRWTGIQTFEQKLVCADNAGSSHVRTYPHCAPARIMRTAESGTEDVKSESSPSPLARLSARDSKACAGTLDRRLRSAQMAAKYSGLVLIAGRFAR